MGAAEAQVRVEQGTKGASQVEYEGPADGVQGKGEPVVESGGLCVQGVHNLTGYRLSGKDLVVVREVARIRAHRAR